MPERTFYDVLSTLAAGAQSMAEKGGQFERLVKAFLEQDKNQSQRFSRVWRWADWPGNGGRPDTGIDLVAEERETGALTAIQCKFYQPNGEISLTEVNKFLTAYGTTPFASGIFVSTSDRWTGNAEAALRDRDKPVQRWGPEVFEQSSIDWSTFDLERPAYLTRRPAKTLRPEQETAKAEVLAGFQEHNRGKLIMACGTGKTLTALRIAEDVAGPGGVALFLTPSISLLSQSLNDWANDAVLPLKPYAVCSDAHAGKGRGRDDDEDMPPYDLAETPSTNPAQLAARFQAAPSSAAAQLTVIFSTYQSLNVIAAAQKQGLPQFDLIICDEAHRTTGISLVGKEESNFRQVHNDAFVQGKKRLYMTATPRIFGDRAKRQARESALTTALASMDDEKLYGPEFHRLSFGQAAEMGILTPYKVVILNVDLVQEVGVDLDVLLSDDKSAVNMDNGARMVGSWNGLGKQASRGCDFSADPAPAKRAVAFSNSIRQSKNFAEYFPQVIALCQQGGKAQNPLQCAVEHVDGTQNAMERAKHLAWLRQEPEDGVCKILSNARCLTEGVDVPALDAILFMEPRRSDIDVVQAVGRVMRKAPGKQYGYIILPIAQAPGATPQETLSSSAYRAVWQVINAIAAHDDRFEAVINQLALAREREKNGKLPDYPNLTPDVVPSDHLTPEEQAVQLMLQIGGSAELRDAILARVVDRYSDPGYWEKWADNIREIAQRHEARIRALLDNQDPEVRPIFDQFLAGLRNNLNDGIAEDDAIGMLSQHLITKPVFDALFVDYAFADRNPVSRAMQGTIDCLQKRGLEKETEGLENFYRDVRVRARGVTSAAGKQQIVAELYERFLKLALPRVAESLGIVYTPLPVVDYIVRSVEDALQAEFGLSVSSEGVHIIDPFVGTGTFITRLLQSGLIQPEDLPRKYAAELHANEIMPLAYYVAAINIEATYRDAADAVAYQPFPGIVFTDTFQSAEPNDPMDLALFPANNERIERQKGLDIRVIMGNPPWSATNNRAYPGIDGKVQETYAAGSTTRHLSALYDPYVKAIRMASDRVQTSERGGIVAFVTNGGFIASNAFDGFRKTLAEEFHSIYCFDLRGDQRTAGERSRQEGGKVFGSGSRAGVAILLLVKKPGESPGATIYYRDIGDYLTQSQKLAILAGSRLAETDWQVITPNAAGDWVGQRSALFATFNPLSPAEAGGVANEPEPIFNRRTLGLVTARDAWCYASSEAQLRENIGRSVAFYNQQVTAFQETKPQGSLTERTNQAKAFAAADPTRFHWDAKNYRDLANGETYTVNEAGFTIGCYRAFFKQRLYFDRKLNNSIRDFPEIYPSPDTDNLGIYITGPGSAAPFSVLMSNGISDAGFTSGNGSSPYIPRYRFIAPQNGDCIKPPDGAAAELERVSNINPAALAQFQAHYGDGGIAEDDLFYYTYGVLHSPQYRETFADDLSKVAARIPMAATLADFRAFAQAGRDLAALHINYETVEPYPLAETTSVDWAVDDPAAYRVTKMSYGGTARNLDKTVLRYNAGLTLSGLPEKAQQYRLGSRSALDWLIDRYQVKTDRASGIGNDPNAWAAETGNPRYILDLVKRVTTVSVKTVDIVAGLPELPGLAEPETAPSQAAFERLADEWERERPRGVDVAEMTAHPAYQSIIAMGEAAVSWILERLAAKPDHWFVALNAITGAAPVPPESRGRVKEMAAAWLEWGRRQGYGV